MRKVIVSLVIGLMSSVLAFGAVDPVIAQINAADQLMRTGDYINGQAAYQKIVTDAATTNQAFLASAQTGVGMCLIRQIKIEEAQVAFAKALKDYPTTVDAQKANITYLIVSGYNGDYTGQDRDKAIQIAKTALSKYASLGVDGLITLQSSLAYVYQGKKDYDNALIEYNKILKDYADITKVAYLFNAQAAIGDIYKVQRKLVEANTAWMTAIQTYVWELGAKDETSAVWVTFNKISPKYLTTDTYKTFLDNTIKATAATEDNAKFLGKLKSEIEKLK